MLDLESVTDIDVTGASSPRGLQKWLAGRRVDLTYSCIRADLVALLDHFDLSGTYPQFRTNQEAVAGLVGPTATTTMEESP